MSIVDTIGTTMDKLAEKVGNAIFHEQGRPIPVLRFAVAKNAALDWAERQEPETLFALERFIQDCGVGTQADAAEMPLANLSIIGNELRNRGYPDQAQYFGDIGGARGWTDGLLSYVQAEHARREAS